MSKAGESIKQGLTEAITMTKLMKENEQLQEKTTQAYQVIGSLLDKLDEFESSEGQRALDYFSDPEIYDSDFLPWILKESKSEKP